MNAFLKVPKGTTDNSPRFQPWVAGRKRAEPRGGERKIGIGPTRSFGPDGTRCLFGQEPSDESLGYFRASLRDSNWIDGVPGVETPGYCRGVPSGRRSSNRDPERGQPCPREAEARKSRTRLSALLFVVTSWSRRAILESRRLSLSRIYPIEQETTEGTEISEPVEALVRFGAQILRKAESAQRIRRGGKLGPSVLRFLLFNILSLAVTTASLVILRPVSAHAQGGVPLWTNRYNGPGNDEDSPRAIAVDNSGNVIVTGSSISANGFPDWDYATIKYSSAGVPLWTNRYNGGNGADGALAVAANDTGNVFVTGYSTGSSGDSDYATVAYSSAGVPLWTNRYDGGIGGDEAFAVAVNNSGNVFVTGRSANINNNSDWVTIAYSEAGLPLWTNTYAGPADSGDEPFAMAVDNKGNVFVTGRSVSLTSDSDYVTVAYSRAGEALWTNRYSRPGINDDGATAIAVDRSGNVFVTGRARTQLPTGGFSGEYATVGYSNAGTPLWTNRYHGPFINGDDGASAIAVDSSGNVFVTGFSYAVNGHYDYATVAYSNAGAPLWTNRYNGPGNGDNLPEKIAVDDNGNVFVTGWSPAANFFSDYATVGYSATGVPLWTNRYNGLGNRDDQARAIAVDKNGNVFVTGISPQSSTNSYPYDYVTIKYSSSVPPPRLDFQLLNHQLVLSWTNAGFNLQSAPGVTGAFTNLPAATSPYTNTPTGPQQFFRLIGE